MELPKSTIVNLIKESLPPGMKASPEYQQQVARYAGMFIRLLADDSNAISEKYGKKTITAEFLIEALRELGFEERYVEESKLTMQMHKQSTAELPSKKTRERLKNSGKTHEQLVEEQRALFAKAHEDYMRSLGEETK